MKYKVWGKAKAVIKPKKHHFEAVAVIAFVSLLIAAIILAVRLGYLYSGTIYSGITEPYLQSLGSDRVTIRWQSEQSVTGKVEISMAGRFIQTVSDLRPDFTHELTITDLQPSTRYQYTLYQDGDVFRDGESYWFETAPEIASDTPVRIWLLGDPGRKGAVIESVKTSMFDWIENNKTDTQQKNINLMISTGDNAYEDGTKQEFQENFFSVHQSLLKNIGIWPVYGNHDARGWSFFKLFTLPDNAELGGVASSTERYYSIDYANIHFIFLDSNEGAYYEDDEMLRWLRQDLDQTQQKWLIVLMHHPAYTKGSHNSNDPRDSANRMFNMRKRVLPVLEQAGVDLVIAGHSHSYERSYLIDCHYGLTSDFKSSSILQSGNDFVKPLQRSSHSGAVYLVLGSSAEVVDAKLNHPAMAVSKAEAGSVLIDVEGNKLQARFINNRAKVTDQFVITKSQRYDALLENNQKTKRSCH